MINKEKYWNFIIDTFYYNNCELLTNMNEFTNKKDKNLTFICSCGNTQDNISFYWYKRAVYTN